MRVAAVVLLVVVLLALAAAAAVGWYFSNQILVPAPYTLMPEFEVVDVGEHTVTLPAPPPDPTQFERTRVHGVYGLLWDGGYGRLGPVLADDGERVVRELAVTAGRSPRPGDPARVDVTVFRRDPLRDHGIPFEDIRLEGEVGPLAAWWIPRGPDAVLVLHGRRRADRTEALRIVPTLVETGASVLVLSWRNHDASGASPDGLYRYGATEFRDALTGARFLAEQGARRVVIYGFSAGATVGLEAAERWPGDAPHLAGFVLDSPLLDPAASIEAAARARGLPAPGLLARIALGVARLRTGLRWVELDQRRTAERLRAPLLLFAGTDDGTVPIEVVDEFAARLTAPMVYRRLPGVEHVEGWNVDPQAYEDDVRAFLHEALPPIHVAERAVDGGE